jgi:transposase-like protein
MKATPQAITGAMQLYFTGESLRNVQKFLRLQGVNVSHVAVYKWIRKYVRLMEKYLDRITPKVSDTWRADELYVKFKGNMKYIFALMDDQTRFWLASEIADSKYVSDVRKLLVDGRELAGKRPMTLITDGALNYAEAFKKEYRTLKGPRSVHIPHVRFDGDRNNNKMERMNGEIRDREKIMRGLKIPDTPILPGYRIYHNFLRPHLGLNGLTPAEACGITIQGSNKWLTLIQNATIQAKKSAIPPIY